MVSVLTPVAFFLLGGLLWPLIEYAIHGFLAHCLRTFVSPLHWAHHDDPRAVFTSPAAWLPALLAVLGAAVWSLGWPAGAALTGGAALGFARYEWLHWRIHFRSPRGAREIQRRAHHLAHHYVDHTAYHGVTTRFWDRVFGSLPVHSARDYVQVAARTPLQGPSNLGRLRATRSSPPPR